MKILTKEEEEAHYNATVKGGFLGGSIGLAAGSAGVFLASRRFPLINHLTVPMKAFLVTSGATFSAIIAADSYSRSFEKSRHPEESFKDAQERQREAIDATKTTTQRAMDWGRENRYSIVGGSWLASMAIALGIVGRNPYLTGAQKLVQARVYAQGLTVAVLIATAAFEISDRNKEQGRWETVKVLDPNDPTHKRLIEKRVHHESYAGEDQWRDMVAAEEERMKSRQHNIEEREAKHHKKRAKKDQKPPATGGEPRPSTQP